MHFPVAAEVSRWPENTTELNRESITYNADHRLFTTKDNVVARILSAIQFFVFAASKRERTMQTTPVTPKMNPIFDGNIKILSGTLQIRACT
jgi:hypothetical protein